WGRSGARGAKARTWRPGGCGVERGRGMAGGEGSHDHAARARLTQCGWAPSAAAAPVDGWRERVVGPLPARHPRTTLSRETAREPFASIDHWEGRMGAPDWKGLEGKGAIVTGASAGIGRATALVFARAGGRLTL